MTDFVDCTVPSLRGVIKYDNNMISAPHLVRSHRLAARLSLRQLASRAGTSAATLSRYESGLIDPTVRTLNRILGACTKRSRRWTSLAALSVALMAMSQEDPDDIWRLVGEFLDDDRSADQDEFVGSVLDPPLPTGKPWVDALVSALGEFLSVAREMAPPPWTQASVEVVPWWFVAGDRFAAVALRESPPSFFRRGIFITRGALERV